MLKYGVPRPEGFAYKYRRGTDVVVHLHSVARDLKASIEQEQVRRWTKAEIAAKYGNGYPPELLARASQRGPDASFEGGGVL